MQHDERARPMPRRACSPSCSRATGSRSTHEVKVGSSKTLDDQDRRHGRPHRAPPPRPALPPQPRRQGVQRHDRAEARRRRADHGHDGRIHRAATDLNRAGTCGHPTSACRIIAVGARRSSSEPVVRCCRCIRHAIRPTPRHAAAHAPRAVVRRRIASSIPVLSRRSGGISIGVNLNPDKICNFDCIYCQVDRTRQSETPFVETDAAARRARTTCCDWSPPASSIDTAKFRDTPPALRRLNDIAFTGDGEPTTYRNFDEIIAACAAVKRPARPRRREDGADHQRQHVPPRRTSSAGWRSSTRNKGEIWAKLEAGTDEYYHLVERTPIPVPADSGQHHRAARAPAARDPVPLHADQRRAAAARRAGSLLRSL